MPGIDNQVGDGGKNSQIDSIGDVLRSILCEVKRIVPRTENYAAGIMISANAIFPRIVLLIFQES